MSVENCTNLIYKRGPAVLGVCIAGLLCLIVTLLLIGPPEKARAAAAEPPPQAPSLVSLDPLSAAATHISERAQADPKPKAPTRATISLYERTTSPRLFRRQGCGAAQR